MLIDNKTGLQGHVALSLIVRMLSTGTREYYDDNIMITSMEKDGNFKFKITRTICEQ